MAASRRSSGSSGFGGAASKSKALRQDTAGSQTQQADAKATDTKEKDRRWWRLVWCHERCFMPECESRRQSLSEAARGSGAALICLKRAARLDRWLTERLTPIRSKKLGSAEEVEARPAPYVLMTDWREMEACSEAIVRQDPVNHPAFTVLMCEDMHQVDLVAPWVRQAPEVMQPVYVCTDLGTPDMFLSCLVGRLLGSSAQLPVQFMRSSSSSRLAKPRLAGSDHSSLSSSSPRQLPDVRQEQEGQTPTHQQDRKRTPPQTQHQQSQPQQPQPQHSWTFAAVGVVAQQASAQELEQAGSSAADASAVAVVARSPTPELHHTSSIASMASQASSTSAIFASPVGPHAASTGAAAIFTDLAGWAAVPVTISPHASFHSLDALPRRDAVFTPGNSSMTQPAGEEQPAAPLLPCGCQCSEELDRLLREAMPEQYEE